MSEAPAQPTPIARLGWRETAFALLITLLVGSFWLSTEVSSPNERTRIYLAHALVTRGEITVDPEWEQWGALFDISRHNDHFYTDKAPGSSILAAPVVAVAVHGFGTTSIETLVMACRHFVMMPLMLLAALSCLRSVQLMGGSRRDGYLATMCVLLASNTMHYGNAFFGHAIVLTFVTALMWVTLVAMRAPPGPRRDLLWALGGCLAGITFSIEYQAALVFIGWAAALILDRETRSIRTLIFATIGVGIPVLLVLGYNAVAFGSPFHTSYHSLYHETSVAIHAEGWAGIGLPKIDAIAGLGLTPARGLLFSAPWFIPALLAMLFTWRGPRLSWTRVYPFAVVLAYGFITTGFGLWTTGWGTGPRTLVAILGPPAIVAVVMLRDAKPWVRTGFLALVACGVAINLLAVVTFPENPAWIMSPARVIHLPMLQAGAFSPSIYTHVGLPSGVGVVLHTLGVVALAGWCMYRTRPTMRNVAIGCTVAIVWFLLLWSYPDYRQSDANADDHLAWTIEVNERATSR